MDYPNIKKNNTSFVNKKINSFYCNLNKNNLNKVNISYSSFSSETINNENESMEDTKKEIRNINCKGKMMINHYEFKENEEIENKKKINNMIKRKSNSTGKINLIPNKRIIKMIEKQKTYKCLISLNQEKLKNLPINSNNSNKTTLNNNNLVHIGREHNDCIINSNKRINKKYVKRFSGMYDTKNNNNINKNF